MKSLPLEKAYQLLQSGPVILLTTYDDGKPNVMTMAWTMDVDFTPVFAIVCSNENFSYKALSKTKECVIAIPAVDLMEKVVKIGSCSGKDTDKFKKIGLTAMPAEKIKAPLIKECMANIECKVIDDSLAEKFNIFILEGVKAWIGDSKKEQKMFHSGVEGSFVIDGEKIARKK
jgi:flavin reductase (DIM6/NTAB) family NADH-FMN oxidoreductase RutF